MKGTLLIQLILLLGAGMMLFLFIRRWDAAHTRAWKRIAFFLFVVANVFAVLRPGDVTWVANRLGVGRGTDLVLYLLVVAVSFFALNTYMRFRSLEKKVTDLARTVALRDAELLNRDRLDRERLDAPTGASTRP
ncbi:DUF2304 domain-containing protein [Streptacidiphilus sp. PB12-B1b]|uniref:DUF2304 domain-containing protein n=1 Tax=Streptacidiphilus sp. PB12-B1b TaxID=2705012 RepID=UPI0015F7CBD9|nr:DUF2304 domain-containing protein [Streptacidiphilus sp. PB12-B1b]QMU79343.1 DUF2304 domain-containing protein [Streptacidiphilus sp. PB12-B1b]